MSKWLERARAKFSETPNQATAITAERTLTAVTAVPDMGVFQKKSDTEASNGSNGSTLPRLSRKKNEVTDLTAFDERAAILEHEAGLTRREAEAVAAVELGRDDDAAFYREQIDAWQQEIKALPRPNMREGQALIACSLEFLASEWAQKALSCGWGEVELFGLFDSHWPAPRSRYDAQGLVPSIALSVYKLKIAKITEQAAILTSRSGSQLRHPRDLPGAQYCRAWWQVLRGDV